MKVKSYKDLDVWKKGIDIVDAIYSITDKFPDGEKYGLVAQMRRASVSIPSNIAEGFMRQHPKEFLQFLYIALSSCAELETQALIASRRSYITAQVLLSIQEMIDHESRMLMNLIKSLRRTSTTNHE